MARTSVRPSEDLASDNSARIVLFDAVKSVVEADPAFDGIDRDELFNLVIPRLRVLVPRELHVQSERAYVEAKVTACVEAEILRPHPWRTGLLLLGPREPKIRYPDATVRDYTYRLEAARERLDADEDRLRYGRFDVRRIVRSHADDKKSRRYQDLVASMREHGFLEWTDKGRSHACFPIIESASGVVIDGVAREAAAADAGLVLKKQHRVKLPRRRDTPLQNALLVLHLNSDRLLEDEVSRVHDAIANHTGRDWTEINRDLELTREWRRAEPKEYDAKLEVKLVPFGEQRDPKVQITLDGTRVMLRSIMREAGMPEYRRDDLLPYLPWEEARTQYSGKKAIFVRIADAIGGIAKMQRDRAADPRLRVDTAWDEVGRWLSNLDGDNPAESETTPTDERVPAD